jgi:hypothetical protein
MQLNSAVCAQIFNLSCFYNFSLTSFRLDSLLIPDIGDDLVEIILLGSLIHAPLDDIVKSIKPLRPLHGPLALLQFVPACYHWISLLLVLGVVILLLAPILPRRELVFEYLGDVVHAEVFPAEPFAMLFLAAPLMLPIVAMDLSEALFTVLSPLFNFLWHL